MSEETLAKLKEKIHDLEKKLVQKDTELAQYRQELLQTNLSLERLIVQIEQEVKLAGKVQRLLSPTELPKIPGLEFSSKFVPGALHGGDYFDIFEHSDKLKFGVLMSSASGYAMSSLFLSVLLKMTSLPEAKKGQSPEALVQRLVQELVPQMTPKDLAHFFYGVVDRRTYELSFCSVGEIYGVIQEGVGKGLQTLDSFCREGLRSTFHEKLESMKVKLNPKDRLILCSEGILNARNPKGDRWGDRGINDALLSTSPNNGKFGVHEIRNNILFKWEQFTEKSAPDKDLTVIVVEVKENILKLATTK